MADQSELNDTGAGVASGPGPEELLNFEFISRACA